MRNSEFNANIELGLREDGMLPPIDPRVSAGLARYRRAKRRDRILAIVIVTSVGLLVVAAAGLIMITAFR